MKSSRKIAGVLPAIGAAFYALPLMAAEHGEKAGLPQLDVAHFPGQLFWLAVCFAFLYAMMAFVALPRVKSVQDNRSSTIASELATATAANEAAKAMIVQYEKALADARAKAQATVSEITTAAAKEAAEKQGQQRQELMKRLAESEARIAAARDAAIKGVSGAAAELAGVMAEKVAGIKAQVRT